LLPVAEWMGTGWAGIWQMDTGQWVQGGGLAPALLSSLTCNAYPF